MTDETFDAVDVLDDAEPRHDRVEPYLTDAVELFIDDAGRMRTRDQARMHLMHALGVEKQVAGDLIRELVGDLVDPVIQVPDGVERFIGVAEYHEFPGAYGYMDYHDQFGHRRRVVCAQCVREQELATEVTHATAGDPAGSFDRDASYNALYAGIEAHYERAHEVEPGAVEVGATLVSGTTVAGNIAWHAGNDGDTSGLDAQHAAQADDATNAVQAENAATVGGKTIYVQDTEPTGASVDDFWVDTS